MTLPCRRQFCNFIMIVIVPAGSFKFYALTLLDCPLNLSIEHSFHLETGKQKTKIVIKEWAEQLLLLPLLLTFLMFILVTSLSLD